ncbi:MAG: T9SS type A sorting domain-containing protein [Taibaiella sp.]|nr:T9SS type A sorting domain-containing protein [Taibaiella sp.]
MKNALVILLLSICTGTFGQGQSRRVLFLGNSYTYTNNLPQMLAGLAMSAGDTLVYDSHLPGGYSLESHYNDSASLNKILSDHWDYIVLQEQSQRPAFIIPSGFMNGFSNLSSFIRTNKPCAQITSFMTWGHQNGDIQNCPVNPAVCTYAGMQSLVTDRYVEMSDLFDAEVTPVGVVWKYIRDNHPAINLYQSDGSHPSLAGSYLAACSFYTTIFRKNPLLITDNLGLDTTTASIIRNAAKSLIFDQMPQWYIGRYIPVSDFNYVIGNGSNEIVINHHAPTYRDSFNWDFGDGTTATALLPTHSYAADGTYTIKLTAYKCYLGANLESVFTRTVNFCSHTNTIYPNLVLCPDATGTLWTQPADSYQWYDESGDPIPGATNQSLQVTAGSTYSVLTSINGCSELSAPMFVDMWVDNPDCGLNIIEKNKEAEVIVFPNPAGNMLHIKTQKTIQAVAIYDAAGRKKALSPVFSSAYDIATLTQGVYLLNITFRNGQHWSAKFLKQ